MAKKPVQAKTDAGGAVNAQKGAALMKKIANDDPDSNIKFRIAGFPINDLMNCDSFITLYPDVLDIIFYNPKIVSVLEKFETTSGFLCSITSLKEVKLANWVFAAVGADKKNVDDMAKLRGFLVKYIESQLFNALLRNTNMSDETVTLDPQEYFDEVATACAEAIAKNVVPEKVKPNLFPSAVEYSIYPVSQSITKNNMLKNVGIVVTMSGNIGVEKIAGGLFKKGTIRVLVDITLKVVVFNNYIFSKRGLTLILNGIREVERRDRAALLDESIDRQYNEVTQDVRIQHDSSVGGGPSFYKKITGALNDGLLDETQKGVDKVLGRTASISTTTTTSPRSSSFKQLLPQ